MSAAISLHPKAEGRGFYAYDDLKAKFVAAGLSEKEIAFIQDCDTGAAKLGVFKHVRTGKVRAILGSTQKMFGSIE